MNQTKVNRLSLLSSAFIMCLVINTYTRTCQSIPLTLELAVTPHKLKNIDIGTQSIFTSGIYLTVPAIDPRFSLRFGSEYGKIAKNKTNNKIGLLFTQISLVYPIQLHQPNLFLTPEVSLVNCAIHINPSGDLKDLVIISTWENEFGIGTGCAFTFRNNRLTVAIPLSVAMIFTSTPAYLISTGLTVGITSHTSKKEPQ